MAELIKTRIREFQKKKSFDRSAKKLDKPAFKALEECLIDLLKYPIPHSRHLEKIKSAPGVYSARINKSYRISFELEGEIAILRRVARHDALYSNP